MFIVICIINMKVWFVTDAFLLLGLSLEILYKEEMQNATKKQGTEEIQPYITHKPCNELFFLLENFTRNWIEAVIFNMQLLGIRFARCQSERNKEPC